MFTTFDNVSQPNLASHPAGARMTTSYRITEKKEKKRPVSYIGTEQDVIKKRKHLFLQARGILLLIRSPTHRVVFS